MFLFDVNFLAVTVAAALYFVLGFFWYSPALFGTAWAKSLKLEMGKEKPSPIHFAGALVVAFIMAWMFAVLFNQFTIITLMEGIKASLLIWFGFIVTTNFSGVIWAKKPFTTYLIDTGFLLISLSLMGALLAVWH